MDALKLARSIRSKGRNVGIFLVADGIYIGKKGRTEVAELLGQMIADGVKVYVSPEHIKAAGFSKDMLVPGIEVAEETYRDLVNFVMEEYEKVIIC